MRAAIYTLGCKVNQYETQAMEQELRRRDHLAGVFGMIFRDAFTISGVSGGILGVAAVVSHCHTH